MIFMVAVLLGACVILVVYPYTVYLLLLTVIPRKAIARSGGRSFSVTLLFCAFNEGSVVAEKLANIGALKLRHPDLEVLAYDDGSTDDTLAQLTARPDLLTVVTGEGRKGKAHGMKALAGLAQGEILVFTDANVFLRTDAITNLMKWYGDPDVGGVCGTLHYLNAAESATAAVGGAYWRLEEALKSLESQSGNVMGSDGSIFSIRRALYPDFPDTVLDDLTVSMAVVFSGKRLIKADDVVGFERLVTDRSDEFARKVRIAARAFHTHLYLRPQLARMSPIDRFKYFSRKLVRWFGGLFLILAAALSLTMALLFSPLLALVAATILIAGIACGNHFRRGPIGIAAEVVLALVATFIGVVHAIRGRTFVTWSPAKSR